MEINTKKKALKALGVFTLASLTIFLAIFALRITHFFSSEKKSLLVGKIHGAKITMADVTGENLPPGPGEEGKETIAGIDANKNGVRDDVELAIFSAYPDSAKTRAELLQYAFALQSILTQSSVGEEGATAIAQEKSRAYQCIGETLQKENTYEFFEKTENLRLFVEEKQLNTEARRKADSVFYEKVRSYNQSHKDPCDIKIQTP